jgi:hypothetical protein
LERDLSTDVPWKRGEEVGELLHQVVVQEASVADSRYPELGELVERWRLRDAEDIDCA